MVWLAIRIEAPSAGLLSYAKGFPSIFVTSLALIAVLGWALSRGSRFEFSIFQVPSHSSWPFLLVHFASFALFFWLTILLFEGGSSYFAAPWILAWTLAGIAAALFWMLAAMPARAWVRLARHNSSSLLLGIIIVAASWVIGFFSNRAWEPLQGPTLRVVQWLLQGFQQDVVCQPAVHLIGTNRFSVDIYPACAGYEGIGLIAVFLAIYFWLFRRRLRFPQAFILLPLGILVIWLLTAIRVASLILVGASLSPQIALGGFPSQTGWIAFIAVALG